jgi:hypothetical protein
MPLPNIGSMDGNTGRSEGATAEKAVPFPCAVIDPNRSFVELRVGEPRPGARSVSSPPEVLKPIRRQLGIAHGVLKVLVAKTSTRATAATFDESAAGRA